MYKELVFTSVPQKSLGLLKNAIKKIMSVV
jgi:hypothetical protein